MLNLLPEVDAMARIGRALADPTRCRILLRLLDGPAYPAEIASALDLSRPNVSNHLSCLRGCGIVVATHEGRQVRYELVDTELTEALRHLVAVTLVSACPTCDDPT